MIMPRGEPLLMPVNPVFIWASLAAGLAINMLPLGRVVWMPDLLMVLLVFWGVHQPLRIGMGAAFALGLCMDVSQSALLGSMRCPTPCCRSAPSPSTAACYGSAFRRRRCRSFRFLPLPMPSS